MQMGYDVANCQVKDCPFRTKPLNRYDLIRHLEEQANLLMNNVSGGEQNVLTRSCKGCVHYDVCYELTYHEPNGEIVGREVCNNFKDKSRFVELPCKVGDVLWICGSVRGVLSAKVRTFLSGIHLFKGNPMIAYR